MIRAREYNDRYRLYKNDNRNESSLSTLYVLKDILGSLLRHKLTMKKLTQEQEKLALEIAHALDDMHSLKWHRDMVLMYSEDHLRKQMAKALSTPDHKVRKSRGAIYTSLVQGHGSRWG